MPRKSKKYLPMVRLIALSAMLLCLVTGCINNNVPSVQVYTLAPQLVPQGQPAEQASQTTIKLATMRAPRTFTSDEIIYSDNQYGQNSYLYSRWSAPPVVLLQQLLQLQLAQNSYFKAVLPPSSTAKANWLLESTLYDFSQHIQTDQTSTGVVRIRFYLIDNNNKAIIATTEFSSSVAAPTANAQGGVTALNQATVEIMLQLNQWLDGLNLR